MLSAPGSDAAVGHESGKTNANPPENDALFFGETVAWKGLVMAPPTAMADAGSILAGTTHTVFEPAAGGCCCCCCVAGLAHAASGPSAMAAARATAKSLAKCAALFISLDCDSPVYEAKGEGRRDGDDRDWGDHDGGKSPRSFATKFDRYAG